MCRARSWLSAPLDGCPSLLASSPLPAQTPDIALAGPSLCSRPTWSRRPFPPANHSPFYLFSPFGLVMRWVPRQHPFYGACLSFLLAPRCCCPPVLPDGFFCCNCYFSALQRFALATFHRRLFFLHFFQPAISASVFSAKSSCGLLHRCPHEPPFVVSSRHRVFRSSCHRPPSAFPSVQLPLPLNTRL